MVPVFKECKGLVFRASINTYLSKHNSIEVKKSLRLLKRHSCGVCEKCKWILEQLPEEFTTDVKDFIGDVVDGKAYEVWIDGYYDDWEFTIREHWVDGIWI